MSDNVLEHIGALFGMTDEARLQVLDTEITRRQQELYAAQKSAQLLAELPEELLDPQELMIKQSGENDRQVKRLDAILVILQRERAALKSGTS